MSKRFTHVDLSRVNVSVLVKHQKPALLRAIDRAPAEDADWLTGILHLLDHIHDTLRPPKVTR